MKKMVIVLFMLFLGTQSLFAGWFSSNIVFEKKYEGKGIFVKKTDFENQFEITDSDFGSRKIDADYSEKLTKRMHNVFEVINSFGKEQGYKSFVLLNPGVSIQEGFPLNNSEQLIEFCMLQGNADKKKYTSFCAGSKDYLLGTDSRVTSAKVLFFKEENKNYFLIK